MKGVGTDIGIIHFVGIVPWTQFCNTIVTGKATYTSVTKVRVAD